MREKSDQNENERPPPTLTPALLKATALAQALLKRKNQVEEEKCARIHFNITLLSLFVFSFQQHCKLLEAANKIKQVNTPRYRPLVSSWFVLQLVFYYYQFKGNKKLWASCRSNLLLYFLSYPLSSIRWFFLPFNCHCPTNVPTVPLCFVSHRFNTKYFLFTMPFCRCVFFFVETHSKKELDSSSVNRQTQTSTRSKKHTQSKHSKTSQKYTEKREHIPKYTEKSSYTKSCAMFVTEQKAEEDEEKREWKRDQEVAATCGKKEPRRGEREMRMEHI